MAVSGTIGLTTFSTNKVIDTAFRRCRIPMPAVTGEMLMYAQDALHLLLSSMANPKPPSWCIEKQLYAMSENAPQVLLDVGTVEVLNVNYRTTTPVTGTETVASTTRTTVFSTATQVTTVGIDWSGAPPATLTFQTSADGVTWTTVATFAPTNGGGVRTWHDVPAPLAALRFRIAGSTTLNISSTILSNTPSEIPLGPLNRDTYAAQTNKVFPGRPNSFWFQRTEPQQVINLWPAPNSAAASAQLVVWRHRHIMDVGPVAGNIEVPKRWMEAIIDGLADRLGAETPSVDIQLLPVLAQRAANSMKAAWEGDNDGSPTFYQPNIAPYTR